MGPDGGRWLPAAEATVLSLEPVSLSLRTALEVALAAAVLYLILGDFHRFQARPGPASRRRCPVYTRSQLDIGRVTSALGHG